MNASYASRLHFDRSVVGGVVAVHDRREHVYVAGKELVQTCLDRAIEPFHDARLLLTVRREEVNVVLTKKRLHFDGHELASLVRLQSFRCATTRKNPLHRRNDLIARFPLKWLGPGVLRKTVDAREIECVTVVDDCARLHVAQVGLPLIIDCHDDGFVTRESKTHGFVQRVRQLLFESVVHILTCN